MEPNTLSTDATAVPVQPERKSFFSMPDVGADLRALPGMFIAKPLLWVPFLLLLVAFFVVLAYANGALPTGVIGDTAIFYAQLTWPFPPLVMFFIGGFLAPRASWLVGSLVGVFYAILFTIVTVTYPGTNAEVTPGAGGGIEESLVIIWVMSIGFGALAAGFASWYRNFLRNSQERARANRMAREKEAALKAKEQAKADRAAQR